MSKMRKVYVWQLPVRVYHWVNALCIVVLSVTGLIIGRPVALQNSIEASFSYWFGIVRFIHFVFAFLFFFNFMFRTFWGFVGNDYARWYHFIPFKKKQWQEIFAVLRIDILQISKGPLESTGHNSMAGFTYFLTFIVFMLQAFTGFALYADMSTSWFPQLFAWISPILGGDLLTRQIHHILMWGFIIFAIIHVYLVFYHDYVEKRGVTSSMIGGWKFIEDEPES
ncbi:MAG: Ni/Fe-hydrogenase, b-type cytochrome subunit [Bacteroidales bacterium]